MGRPPHPPTTGILVANVFLLSLFGYVIQFCAPSKKFSDRVQGKLCRFVFRMPGPPYHVLSNLREVGFKQSLRHIRYQSIAALVKYDCQPAPGGKRVTSKMPMAVQSDKAFREYCMICGCDIEELRALRQNLLDNKPKRDQFILYQNMLDKIGQYEKNRAFWKGRAAIWIGHPGAPEDVLVKSLSSHINSKILFANFRLDANLTPTKRRTRYRGYQDVTCAFCSYQIDSTEHWCHPDPRHLCPAIRKAAASVGLIREHGQVQLPHFLGTQEHSKVRWSQFVYPVFIIHSKILWGKRIYPTQPKLLKVSTG